MLVTGGPNKAHYAIMISIAIQSLAASCQASSSGDMGLNVEATVTSMPLLVVVYKFKVLVLILGSVPRCVSLDIGLQRRNLDDGHEKEHQQHIILIWKHLWPQ